LLPQSNSLGSSGFCADRKRDENERHENVSVGALAVSVKSAQVLEGMARTTRLQRAASAVRATLLCIAMCIAKTSVKYAGTVSGFRCGGDSGRHPIFSWDACHPNVWIGDFARPLAARLVGWQIDFKLDLLIISMTGTDKIASYL